MTVQGILAPEFLENETIIYLLSNTYNMEKAKINYLVDVLLAISFVIVAVTGIIKLKIVSNMLGVNYIFFRETGINFAHDMSGVAMTILVVIHLILHWNWIVCMTKSIFIKKEKKCD